MTREPALRAARLGAAVFAAIVVATTARADTRLLLKVGETATLDAGAGLTLELGPVRVVSDERCPAPATCVWANPPVVDVRFQFSSVRTDRRLTMNDAVRGEFSFAGWRVAFIDLKPYPRRPAITGYLQPQDAYRVELSAGKLDGDTPK